MLSLLSPEASVSINDEYEIAIIPATNTAIKKNAALFFTDLLYLILKGLNISRIWMIE